MKRYLKLDAIFNNEYCSGNCKGLLELNCKCIFADCDLKYERDLGSTTPIRCKDCLQNNGIFFLPIISNEQFCNKDCPYYQAYWRSEYDCILFNKRLIECGDKLFRCENCLKTEVKNEEEN